MARIAIDLSHEQREWYGYYPSVLQQCKPLTAHTFETIEKGRGLDAATLAPYDALILALPCNVELREDEINAVRAWVTEEGKGIFLLSSYSGDAHHRTNLNALARPFGIRFNEDLVLPHDRTTDNDGHAQVYDRGASDRYTVRVDAAGLSFGAHPLSHKIQTLGFLSTCSLNVSNPQLQFWVSSPADSAALEPASPIRNSKGWIMKINWALSAHKSVILLAAGKADSGKIVACGSWKLWLPELLVSQSVDNAQLFANVVDWLIQ
ncbi:MAG: hypothetical protein HDKAJFGB_04028 [Anaerolineae bacterium]|nr:hypothetical protein [Anaerolineae bacterium]